MVKKYWKYFLGVLLVTLFADWFVQLGYFLVQTYIFHQSFGSQRTLFDYQTGFIGDFVILPIINCTILYLILKLKIKKSDLNLKAVALWGLIGDLVIHFMQGYLKLTNWSMPTPFHWNFVSYFHMVSFFFQWSFIGLFFNINLKFFKEIKKKGAVQNGVVLVWSLMFLFVVMFLHDYHWLI